MHQQSLLGTKSKLDLQLKTNIEGNAGAGLAHTVPDIAKNEHDIAKKILRETDIVMDSENLY